MMITDDDVQEILKKQIELAKQGNTAAAEFVFNVFLSSHSHEEYDEYDDDDLDDEVNTETEIKEL